MPPPPESGEPRGAHTARSTFTIRLVSCRFGGVHEGRFRPRFGLLPGGRVGRGRWCTGFTQDVLTSALVVERPSSRSQVESPHPSSLVESLLVGRDRRPTRRTESPGRGSCDRG